ncbi:MAG: GDP-L-fucose synthase [Dehalococcoidales bacterium]|nr:GDP-L-fucose synthase [Dehalococcoidales bacterium]
MNKSERILVTAHRGMIGSAILRRLNQAGFTNLVTDSGLDLTDQKAVANFIGAERPAYIFLAVAKIGGIMANSKFPAEFIYENMQSQANVIHSAWKSGVKKLIFLASSCIYPKASTQPMKEEYLLTGKVEPTSEAYAIAKIAGITMCRSYNIQYGTNFISVIPGDLYGPGDDFNPETAHVLPSLLGKMHDAKVQHKPDVVLWGTGSPRREALYIDDLADACLFLMEKYDGSEPINIGSGQDFSIMEMATAIKEVTGFGGNVAFDKSKPDGAPRKLLDTTKMQRLGWSPKIGLMDGIRLTYEWYKESIEKRSKL